MPVLEHAGFSLYESQAILRYLNRVRPTPALIPGDSIAPQLAFAFLTQEWPVLGASHANIVAWLARMEARPSLQATTWDRVAEMAKAA